MSYESNIEVDHHFFAGEDKTLGYEIFAAGSTTVMDDVASFSMQWELRRTASLKDPFRAQGDTVVVKSTTAGGVSITGTYNSARAVNTQRVIVSISDVDTESLPGARYVCALKRMDPGLESVLSHGVVELLVASVR